MWLKVILIEYVEESDRSYKLTQATQDDTSRHKLTNSYLKMRVCLLSLSFVVDLHFISKTCKIFFHFTYHSLNLAADIYFIDVNRNFIPAHRDTDSNSNITTIP